MRCRPLINAELKFELLDAAVHHTECLRALVREVTMGGCWSEYKILDVAVVLTRMLLLQLGM